MLVFSGLILWNALRVKRSFTVLYNEKLNFCFLIDDHYQFKIEPDEIFYQGGKNMGHISLIRGKISSDVNVVDINGLVAGYKKIKNFRIYEFKLNDQYKLRDEFQNIENRTVNLVPYREECSKIRSNFKNHIKIFEGV